MMTASIRQVRGVSAVVGVAALAIVFATAAGLVPADSLPHAADTVLDAIPHINAVLSLIAIPTILYGWGAIRRNNITRHRYAMVSGFGLFVTFLVLYLYKVALEGPTRFDGPATVDSFVYVPVLAIHIVLAIVCVPLLVYVLVLGLTQPIPQLRDSDHPRIGRIAAPLWITSFALGLVVYVLLYVLY